MQPQHSTPQTAAPAKLELQGALRSARSASKPGSIVLCPLKAPVLRRFQCWHLPPQQTSHQPRHHQDLGLSPEHTGHRQAGKLCFPARVWLMWEVGATPPHPLPSLHPSACSLSHSLWGVVQGGESWGLGGFNDLILSTSGWKTGFRVSPEPGSVLAPANDAWPGEASHSLWALGWCRAQGCPRGAGSLPLLSITQRENEMLYNSTPLDLQMDSLGPKPHHYKVMESENH